MENNQVMKEEVKSLRDEVLNYFDVVIEKEEGQYEVKKDRSGRLKKGARISSEEIAALPEAFSTNSLIVLYRNLPILYFTTTGGWMVNTDVAKVISGKEV